MEQVESKFIEYKKKLILLKQMPFFYENLKKNQLLNRNFQFQIYLLSKLKKDDETLKNTLNELTENKITIHIFNEYLSKEQIISLLESNNYKLSIGFCKNYDTNSIEEIKKQIYHLKKDDEKIILSKKYLECFEKSKNKKWFKRTKSKAVVITMFLSLFPKQKNKKFKLLMNDTINNLNSEFDLNIDLINTDQEFIKIFYEKLVNWSVKKSLLITLLILIISFFVVLSIILICVYNIKN